MSQEFSLNQKMVTTLITVFVVLIFLVFIAGYLSGTLVGLPEPEPPPPVAAPVVKPLSKPPVVAMPVPQPDADPETEAAEGAAAPEPEPIEAAPAPEPIEAVPAEKLYSVQVGAFKTRERAEAQQQQIAAKGYNSYIYHGANSRGSLWYTLRLSDFDDVDEAVTAARDFMALEGSPVVLTHFDSLMMVRDENGKRIEIAPADEPESATEEPALLADAPEPGTEEPALLAEEPEPAAAGAEGRGDRSVGGLIVTAESNQYAVQVGAFLNGDNAVKFAEKLKGRGYPAYVFQYTDTAGNHWNAVRAGDFKDVAAARTAAADFEEKEKITAIVTKIDNVKMIF